MCHIPTIKILQVSSSIAQLQYNTDQSKSSSKQVRRNSQTPNRTLIEKFHALGLCIYCILLTISVALGINLCDQFTDDDLQSVTKKYGNFKKYL